MSNPQTRNDASGAIDLGQVLSGILQRKHWIALTTAIAAAGSIAFVMTATPAYQSESRVLVKNLETPLTQLGRQPTAAPQVNQPEVVSQVEVVQSRDLVLRVIRDLNLTKTREFVPPLKSPGFLGQLLITLGFKSDDRKQTPEQRALKRFYKKFTAYQIPTSNVIVVNVKSKKAKRAAQIANKLAEEFVATTREAQSKTTGRARSWLETQVEKLKKAVEKSETEVEKFRAAAGLLKGRDNTTTLSNQELSELNSQIILAEAQRAEIQARAKAIRNLLATQGSVANSNEVLNSPLIQRLRERQIALEGRIADLSTTYLPNHPRIKAVRRQIAGLQRQIRREALKIVAGLEQQAKVAATREASLRASLNNLKTRASGTNLDQVKLRELERKAKADRTLLEAFMVKLSDAKARDKEAFQPGRARIISTAMPAGEPYFPKAGPTVLLATLGGFFLSTGLAFMAAVMSAVSAGTGRETTPRQSVTKPQRAQTASAPQPAPAPKPHKAPAPAPVTAAPVHNTSPVPPSPPVAVQAPVSPPFYASNAPEPAPTPVAQRYQEPPVAHAFQADQPPKWPGQLPISTNINAAVSHAAEPVMVPGGKFAKGIEPVGKWVQQARLALGFHRIGVVGLPGSDLDTAATALGLARALAGANVRTIIVDAAMQGSRLSELANTGGKDGLADLITGHAQFADVIAKDQISATRIMGVGNRLQLAWPLLASDRMETILAALEGADTYDVVIVHAGHLPIDSMARNGALAKCQSSLLIVPGDQIEQAASGMAALKAMGLASEQFMRISDGHGAEGHKPQATHLSDVIAGQAASVPSTQPHAVAQHAHQMPVFSKIAS